MKRCRLLDSQQGLPGAGVDCNSAADTLAPLWGPHCLRLLSRQLERWIDQHASQDEKQALERLLDMLMNKHEWSLKPSADDLRVAEHLAERLLNDPSDTVVWLPLCMGATVVCASMVTCRRKFCIASSGRNVIDRFANYAKSVLMLRAGPYAWTTEVRPSIPVVHPDTRLALVRISTVRAYSAFDATLCDLFASRRLQGNALDGLRGSLNSIFQRVISLRVDPPQPPPPPPPPPPPQSVRPQQHDPPPSPSRQEEQNHLSDAQSLASPSPSSSPSSSQAPDSSMGLLWLDDDDDAFIGDL